MKKKSYIKLNNSDNYLSFGNLLRIIKENSNTTNTFWQSDLFSIIFNTDTVADSTVNNYCTGFRSINSKYKKYIQNIKTNYEKDKKSMKPLVSKIVSLISNTNKEELSIQEINENENLKIICEKLYSISKNDTNVSQTLSMKLFNYLETNDLYSFFIEVLFYTILEKKQPIFIEDDMNNLIEQNIYETNISFKNIKDYVNIQLNSGLWSIRGIYELAIKNNPFACFEMASMEYYGIISGYPRYDIAYNYFKTAASYNHPAANWAIGNLYYTGKIGNNSKKDLYLTLKYFNKARKLKFPYVYNSIGLIYLKGNIPHIRKSESNAIKYFQIAAEKGNVYAYNNLGKIYENKKNYKKAFENFIQSANMNESWACNRIGDYYRKGLYVKKDLKKSFEYFNKSSQAPNITLCDWSKYNLAIYFYKTGQEEINIPKDINKAIKLLDEIHKLNIKANEELIYIYYDLYKENSSKANKEKLDYYINEIENNKQYNSKLATKINTKLKQLKKNNTKIKIPK